MGKQYTIKPLTLEQACATLRDLDDNIVSMIRTSIDIGERYGYDSDLSRDIASDIERWVAAREVLATKIRAMRNQQAQQVA